MKRAFISRGAVLIAILAGCTKQLPPIPETEAPTQQVSVQPNTSIDLPMAEDPAVLALQSAVKPLGGVVKRYTVPDAPAGDLSAPKVESQKKVCVDLTFRGKPITDEQLAAVAAEPGFRQVDSLCLYGANITDEGMKYLVNAERVTSLNVGNSKVTDKGLEYLKGHKSLCYLITDGSKITPAAEEQLLRSLPALDGKWGPTDNPSLPVIPQQPDAVPAQQPDANK